MTLRAARPSGMYAAERGSADTHTVQVVLASLLVVASAPLFFSDPVVALSMLVASGITLVAVRRYAEAAFGGMSGDLAGFFLQVAELMMVVCIALVGRLA